MKALRQCAAWFAVILVVSLVVLGASMLVPQSMVEKNFQKSIPLMQSEGDFPRVFNQNPDAQLDNWSEAWILSQAVAMDAAHPEHLFTNPMYLSSYEKMSPVDSLSVIVDRLHNDAPDYFYARYWMGFRAPVRLLLAVLDLSEIRGLLSMVFFGLFALTICAVMTHAGKPTALLFALSIILVRPQTISSSMQLSCDFLLAMLGMLCIPTVIRRRWEAPFFMAMGMLTMFFDFYTTPLLTLMYPLLYWVLLAKPEKPCRTMLIYMGAWLAGYGLMWIAKLALTTIFTSVNGFENGFGQFATRVGIVKDPTTLELYSVPGMVLALASTILHHSKKQMILCAVGILAGLAAWGSMVKRSGVCMADIRGKLHLLLPAAMVMVWYSVAAQPTIVHSWFQYRMVAAIYFSGFLFLWETLRSGKKV